MAYSEDMTYMAGANIDTVYCAYTVAGVCVFFHGVLYLYIASRAISIDIVFLVSAICDQYSNLPY